MIEFKLNKIDVFNFACYYGSNTLDFTQKSDKNIFLFKLPNGFGKTSLFHAVKWGFYGEDVEFYKDSDKINVKDFLNDRLDSSKDVCAVEINFEYGADNYVLRREYRPSLKKHSTFSLSRNGEFIDDLDEAQEELNNIIPKNFADFFMFDGEQLSHFMSAQKELNFRDSIHQLLGLKQLRVLRDDLLKLQSRYEKELTQQKSTNKEVESMQNTIKSINRDIDGLEAKIDINNDVITNNIRLRDEFDEKRNRYAKLPDVMNKLNDTNDKILSISNDIMETRTSLDLRSKDLFIKFIQKDLDDYIEDNNERIQHLEDICGLDDLQAMRQAAKENMLKMSIPKCDLCGHRLTESETEKFNLEQEEIGHKLMMFEENKEERDALKDERVIFQNFLNRLDGFDFQTELYRLDENMSRLEGFEKTKGELKKESQREEYGSLAEINRHISFLEEENTSKDKDIKLFEKQIREYRKNKDSITRDIKKLGHDDTITFGTTERISHASRIATLLDDALEKGTKSKRNMILKRSNELFMEITNKPDEYGGIDFESDDSYAFVIKTKDDRTVKNPSKGEKQVLAMSFLLGLSQYTGRNNVIMMDTPVASLDDVHSAGIGKALSNLKNQVIFLAQPQELQGDIYKNMLPSVAEEYLVERNDYRSTFIEVEV